MKHFPRFLAAVMLLAFIGCDEEKFDDDEYGDHCLVRKVEVVNGVSTIITYDQYDRVITMAFTMPGQGSGRMDVTYNNDMAFIDYYSDQHFTQTAEATLNGAGNLVNVDFSDPQGMGTGDLQFSYNDEGRVERIAGVHPVMGVNGSVTIHWEGENPVRFSSTDGLNVDCEYFTGQRSSLYMGVGNVALLYQPLTANFAMMYSTDLLKTYDRHSVIGPALELIYEKDSDDKVREIYYSTTTGEAFGTSLVNYECHTSH